MMKPMSSILLVEDDAAIAELVHDLLELAGHAVVRAAGAGEALAACSNGTRFDLVLTDVALRGMDGRELADELRRRHPLLRVLYTSGHALDLRPFLQKPFTAAELTAAVSSAIG
jgi:CheY-like chemotaxis protein